MSTSFQDSKQSLQERLHTLLTRLSDTSEILKKWPDTKGSDTTIHIKTTDKLINSIERIVDGIKLVEEKVNCVPTGESSGTDKDLPSKLRQIAIPLDLLDMMDYAGGLNPDCFARGLMEEAQRQMGNLKRRKMSMDMLAHFIQNGMKDREEKLRKIRSLDEKIAAADKREAEKESKESEENTKEAIAVSKKRKRDDDDGGDLDAPATKR